MKQTYAALESHPLSTVETDNDRTVDEATNSPAQTVWQQDHTSEEISLPADTISADGQRLNAVSHSESVSHHNATLNSLLHICCHC